MITTKTRQNPYVDLDSSRLICLSGEISNSRGTHSIFPRVRTQFKANKVPVKRQEFDAEHVKRRKSERAFICARQQRTTTVFPPPAAETEIRGEPISLSRGTSHLTHIAQASPIARVTAPLHFETTSITLRSLAFSTSSRGSGPWRPPGRGQNFRGEWVRLQ